MYHPDPLESNPPQTNTHKRNKEDKRCSISVYLLFHSTFTKYIILVFDLKISQFLCGPVAKQTGDWHHTQCIIHGWKALQNILLRVPKLGNEQNYVLGNNLSLLLTITLPIATKSKQLQWLHNAQGDDLFHDVVTREYFERILAFRITSILSWLSCAGRLPPGYPS